MLVGYVTGSTSVYKLLEVMTLKTSNHSEVRLTFPYWIKRPANFKPSGAQNDNEDTEHANDASANRGGNRGRPRGRPHGSGRGGRGG